MQHSNLNLGNAPLILAHAFHSAAKTKFENLKKNYIPTHPEENLVLQIEKNLSFTHSEMFISGDGNFGLKALLYNSKRENSELQCEITLFSDGTFHYKTKTLPKGKTEVLQDSGVCSTEDSNLEHKFIEMIQSL